MVCTELKIWASGKYWNGSRATGTACEYAGTTQRLCLKPAKPHLRLHEKFSCGEGPGSSHYSKPLESLTGG